LQPALDVIRRLAIALGVSADMVIFDEKERDPSETLRYQFETVSRMSGHDQGVIRELLDVVISRNQVAGAIERVVKQVPGKSTSRGAAESRGAAHQE